MKLWEYTGKRVKLIDINDKEWIGIACYYTSAQDNDAEFDAIDVDTGNGLIEFYENEIKNIEEVQNG